MRLVAPEVSKGFPSPFCHSTSVGSVPLLCHSGINSILNSMLLDILSSADILRKQGRVLWVKSGQPTPALRYPSDHLTL